MFSTEFFVRSGQGGYKPERSLCFAQGRIMVYSHRGAIQEAPCTIKSVKSLIYSYRASNCFITYTVNHGILWFDHVKST